MAGSATVRRRSAWSFAARIRCVRRIALVRGPTPPGTEVMAAATACALSQTPPTISGRFRSTTALTDE
jgi:hypothetical protein